MYHDRQNCFYLIEREVEHPQEGEGDKVSCGSGHHTEEGDDHPGQTKQIHTALGV